MFREFTEEEKNALSEIARIDEWAIEELQGLVKHELFNGRSFKNAVMQVLSHAKRPVDPDPKRDEIVEKARALRDKMFAEFTSWKEKQKKGVLS